MTLDDLKATIVVKLDEMEFLDILGLTIEDLVAKFGEEIEENREEFEQALE